MKIKKGDTVIVISGKDKGKTGKVTLALPKEGRIVVEGVSMRTKHQKPRRGGQKGQIVKLASPIDASNVLLVDPKTGKGTRVGFKTENGRKVRIAKRSGAAV